MTTIKGFKMINEKPDEETVKKMKDANVFFKLKSVSKVKKVISKAKKTKKRKSKK